MAFLKSIQNSIYSPAFYKTVITKSFKSNLSYFLLMILILTTIKAITLIGPLFIEAPQAIKDYTTEILNCYPLDLEVKITNGKVSSNTTEPYFIPFCKDLTNPQKLAVIDTKTPYSQNQFDNYKTNIWVTKDFVAYKKNNYETRTYSLSQIKDFTLNRKALNSYQSAALPYLKFIGPVLLILSFIGIYLAYNMRLVYLLLLSAIVFLLGKILKKELTYGQSFKAGLHAVTLGFIVELIIGLTFRWIHFPGFSFMFTIITLGVIIFNLFIPKSPKTS